MANYTTNTSDKSRKTALLLCIFLGWVHIIFMLEELDVVLWHSAHLTSLESAT